MNTSALARRRLLWLRGAILKLAVSAPSAAVCPAGCGLRHAPAVSASSSRRAVRTERLLRIDRQGMVTLRDALHRDGAGHLHLDWPMLIAEELEVDVDKVVIEHAPPDNALYVNPSCMAVQIRLARPRSAPFWTPLRQAGAIARVMLLSTAAQQWNVDPATCQCPGTAWFLSGRTRPPRLRRARRRGCRLPVPAPDSVALKRRPRTSR